MGKGNISGNISHIIENSLFMSRAQDLARELLLDIENVEKKCLMSGVRRGDEDIFLNFFRIHRILRFALFCPILSNFLQFPQNLKMA